MSKQQQRREAVERREQLLDAALMQARKVGYQNLRRADVAALAGVTPQLVTHYFGTMANLERDVVRKAIRDGDSRILAQGIANGDRRFRKLTPEQKFAALSSL